MLSIDTMCLENETDIKDPPLETIRISLSDKNRHPRDKYIEFFDVGHRYDLTDPLTGEMFHPTSTTTLIHKYFNDFDAYNIIAKFFIKPPDINERYYSMTESEIMKVYGKNKAGALKLINRIKNKPFWIGSKYFNKTAEEIKKGWIDNGTICSQLGSDMHLKIEHFLDNIPIVDESDEFKYFLKFWQDFNVKYPTFKPYRLEWLIYDIEKRISGSIDCVLEDDKGNVILLDWKRSKEIKFENRFQKGKGYFSDMDDCNKNHYTLQLSIYRHILQKNYNKRVVFCMLVIFHPNQPTYQCIPVEMLDLTEFWQTL